MPLYYYGISLRKEPTCIDQRSGPLLNHIMADALLYTHEYFIQRAQLGDLHSNFSCDPHCKRTGCKSQHMQVPVTIFDVIGAASCRGKSLPEIFRENYFIGLLPVRGQEWVVRITAKIGKPCPYLIDDRCSIYAVRPLACMLFPESLVLKEDLEQISKRPIYNQYPCIQRGLKVSPDRTLILKKLNNLLQRELLLSDGCLFKCSPFLLDLENQQNDIPKELPSRFEAATVGDNTDEAFWMGILDGYLQDMISRLGMLSEMDAKIVELENLDMQRNLLNCLLDVKLCNRLARKYQDSQRVFRIVDGALKPKRMSLIPQEVRFM
jgi:Fe-S-cluster containining protein